MTEAPRVPLYDRLPEIYRIRDAEETPPGMLAAYLRAPEAALSALHENIEALYDDLFGLYRQSHAAMAGIYHSIPALLARHEAAR